MTKLYLSNTILHKLSMLNLQMAFMSRVHLSNIPSMSMSLFNVSSDSTGFGKN